VKTIVISPHPDDEVLGVGGTLLRRKSEGCKIAWVIVTGVNENLGWSHESVERRKNEILQITQLFNFDAVYELNFTPAKLDQVPMIDLVSAISECFKDFQPAEVFLPHPSDVHTDHGIVFDAAASCTKWFRNPSIKRVMAYETLSETDFNLGLKNSFQPNVFVNIESFLDLKIKAMEIYKSEVGIQPFPRSREVISALSVLRGGASGFKAAEAFQLLRERG
jgi:LmbE family N-acetylglucosaminyl deacetylase